MEENKQCEIKVQNVTEISKRAEASARANEMTEEEKKDLKEKQ